MSSGNYLVAEAPLGVIFSVRQCPRTNLRFFVIRTEVDD
jgi:hypothetical protein